MGTSSSSGGPGGGVPLVPPWVPDPNAPTDSQNPPPPGIAPPARFGTARRHLGDFARSGDRSSLGKGIGHYVRSGLGGSENAARRMGGAAMRSGALYGVLQSVRSNTITPAELGIDAKSLAGRSAKEIIDRIAQFISPNDGTQDSESSQRAINQALSDLLSENEYADISSLDSNQIDWVIERHIVYEIYQRIELDVGKTILEKAPSPSAAMERQDEIRSYIEEKVASSFRARHQNPLTSEEAQRLTSKVMQDTFEVFEEYIQ